MTGFGRAWAAGEEAMESLAPEGGLFARLDPVSFTTSLYAVAMRASRNPAAASAALWQFGSALARIGPEAVVRWLGRDTAGPERPEPRGRTLAGDKRFADPAWHENPAFFAIGRSYLAAARLADDLLAAGHGDPMTDA